MMRFKKAQTAAEFMKELEGDPEWVRQNEEHEAELKAAQAQFRAEEKPITDDLARVGHGPVWDLVNSSLAYPAAIPVLLKHLGLPYHSRIREGIIRALTVKEARGIAAQKLLEELKRQDEKSPDEVRWALANSLTVVADKSMIKDLEALITDARYQDVVERLKLALKKIK